jgi:hypothetical protein
MWGAFKDSLQQSNFEMINHDVLITSDLIYYILKNSNINYAN